MERMGRPERRALVVWREPIGRVSQATPCRSASRSSSTRYSSPSSPAGRRSGAWRRVLQPSDELDRQLDALARHDARRLHDEQPVFAHPELGAQPTTDGRCGRGRGRSKSNTFGITVERFRGAAQLRGGEAVDADVPDARQVGWEGLLEHLGDDAAGESLALPPVVVVVADRRQPALSTMRRRATPRGRCIGIAQAFSTMSSSISSAATQSLEDRDQLVGEPIDLAPHGVAWLSGSKAAAVTRAAGGSEVHGWHQPRLVRSASTSPRRAAARGRSVQDGLPLGGLERDAVHARQPCGHNTDVHAPIVGTIRRGSTRPRAFG